jgi:NAD(P)H-flavin reductase
MRVHRGKVVEIQLDEAGEPAVWISCPPAGIPSPGQFSLAVSQNQQAVLPEVLFPVKISPHGFLTKSPIQMDWRPGNELELRGPYGNGFRLPATARRVALVGLGETTSRLMPLAENSLNQGSAVTLYGDFDFTGLPASLEAYPLSALREAYDWAEYIAADMPMELLPELPRLMELEDRRPTCPVQILVVTPVPCGGMGECGACAVKTRRGWKYACRDGPVFDLKELDI